MPDSIVKLFADLTPLGLLGLFVFFAYSYGMALIRERRADRITKQAIALSEQETLRKRDEAMKEREHAFFESISDIRSFASAVRDLVGNANKRDAVDQIRNDQMIDTLSSIGDSVKGLGKSYEGLGESYRGLVTGQDALLTGQRDIFSNVFADTGVIHLLKAEINHNNLSLQEALNILRRIEQQISASATQETLATIRRLEALLSEQSANANHVIVEKPTNEEETNEPI